VQVYYFEHEEFIKRLVPRFSYVSQSIGFLYSKKMRLRLEQLVADVDIVHTHLPFNYPTYAAAHAAFRHHKPLIYHQRGVLAPASLNFRSLKKKLYLALIEKPILERATTLIALTEAERENYRLLGVRTACQVIPNGIDATQYSRTYDEQAMLKLGIREEHSVLLFMGRIHPTKGVDLLLDAFIQMHARNTSAVLVLAGPDQFGLQAQFKRRVRQAGLIDRVIFPGMAQGELKRSLLGRADLFCLPSASEGFSIAVLEALASYTAVLLSPGCNFPDVEQAGAGKVCGRTARTFAIQMEAMLVDKPALRAMGDRGRQLVEARFNWDSITDRLIETYQYALQPSRLRKPSSSFPSLERGV
jgi:glycosyltransferase involved in cell wall biosynthesis